MLSFFCIFDEPRAEKEKRGAEGEKRGDQAALRLATLFLLSYFASAASVLHKFFFSIPTIIFIAISDANTETEDARSLY